MPHSRTKITGGYYYNFVQYCNIVNTILKSIAYDGSSGGQF